MKRNNRSNERRFKKGNIRSWLLIKRNWENNRPQHLFLPLCIPHFTLELSVFRFKFISAVFYSPSSFLPSISRSLFFPLFLSFILALQSIPLYFSPHVFILFNPCLSYQRTRSIEGISTAVNVSVSSASLGGSLHLAAIAAYRRSVYCDSPSYQYNKYHDRNQFRVDE